MNTKSYRLLCNSTLACFSLFLLFVFRARSLRPFHIYLRAPRIFRRDTLSLCRPVGSPVAKITSRKKVRVIKMVRLLHVYLTKGFHYSLLDNIPVDAPQKRSTVSFSKFEKHRLKQFSRFRHFNGQIR